MQTQTHTVTVEENSPQMASMKAQSVQLSDVTRTKFKSELQQMPGPYPVTVCRKVLNDEN